MSEHSRTVHKLKGLGSILRSPTRQVQKEPSRAQVADEEKPLQVKETWLSGSWEEAGILRSQAIEEESQLLKTTAMLADSQKEAAALRARLIEGEKQLFGTTAMLDSSQKEAAILRDKIIEGEKNLLKTTTMLADSRKGAKMLYALAAADEKKYLDTESRLKNKIEMLSARLAETNELLQGDLEMMEESLEVLQILTRMQYRRAVVIH